MDDYGIEMLVIEVLREFKEDLKLAIRANDKSKLTFYEKSAENGFLCSCISYVGKTYLEFYELCKIEERKESESKRIFESDKFKQYQDSAIRRTTL